MFLRLFAGSKYADSRNSGGSAACIRHGMHPCQQVLAFLLVQLVVVPRVATEYADANPEVRCCSDFQPLPPLCPARSVSETRQWISCWEIMSNVIVAPVLGIHAWFGVGSHRRLSPINDH
jgi:hypothetical protein